ncbi:MAG: metallophosphoesterase [Myxococcales bacterium]|nr:metallophosphoesterase [Myxococcales bacterium]MCB9643935.1 metallophosphoesterase [Myxococcales bacterium]
MPQTSPWMGRRVVFLPSDGVLFCATDLHGHLEDYLAMKALYLQSKAAGERPFLLFCGDMIHGPSKDMLEEGGWPDFLGDSYPDQSVEILTDYWDFAATERTLCLMGNHEHAHVGGPLLQKFHPDEAGYLDACLGKRLEQARSFWRALPLIAIAPCGVVFTHACPSESEACLADYEKISYEGFEGVSLRDMYHQGSLGALLWSRCATDKQARAFLDVVRAEGQPSNAVVFGHDIVRCGYEKSGPYQLCLSTSFGLHREKKRYLRLDLGQHYGSVDDLREGIEILELYA